MKKIGILTFHRANNYGAVLQAYALNKTLNDLGADAEEIDYFPTIFKNIYYMNSPFSFKHPGISLKIRKLLVHKILKKRNKGFDNFVNSTLKLSKKYSQNDLLSCETLPYDAFITGSDQVWHDTCARFDPIFFLDFPAAENKKKYSYAASFNLNVLPEDKYSEYHSRLSKFNGYSVREQAAVDIIKQLLNIKSNVHCDPTFLVNVEQWRKLISNADKNIRDIKIPFVFVYYVKPSKMLMEYAKRISFVKKLPVICVPCSMEFDVMRKTAYSEYGFKLFPDASPYDFLSLINSAELVLTNSFHGTAFSVIFKKKFFVVLDSDDGSLNSRSKNLLDKLNLTTRILDSQTRIEQIESSIDWKYSDNTIKKEVTEALKYLKQICGSVQNE